MATSRIVRKNLTDRALTIAGLRDLGKGFLFRRLDWTKGLLMRPPVNYNPPMKPTHSLTAVVLLFLAASLPLLAHHSLTAEFDFNTRVDITGTIVQIMWGAPHVLVLVDAKDPKSEETKHWKLQMASPVCMQQHGVGQKTMVVGSTVTVRDTPRAKNGSMTVPVFTMIYDNKSIRVSRSPSDTGQSSNVLNQNVDPWCAP